MAGSSMEGGRRCGGRRHRPNAAINVTPFVDVMLVLLIVFMITAPLLTVGVPVDLPRTDAQNLTSPDEPLIITVNAEGAVYVQETRVELDDLVQFLAAVTEANAEAKIYIRGDRSISYGTVVDVMGRLTVAGFSSVSLVAEMPVAGG